MSRCSSRSSLLRTQTLISTRSLTSWFEHVFKLWVRRGFSVSRLKVVLRFIFIHLQAFDLRGLALIGFGRVMDGAGKCDLCNGNPSLILSWWYGSELLFSLSWVFVNIYVVFTCRENLIILYAVSANTATHKLMREIIFSQDSCWIFDSAAFNLDYRWIK